MLARLLAFSLLTAEVFAQTAAPEVRGVIHESGGATGIPGVEVGLYEFGPNDQNFIVRKLVTSTFTDTNGAYVLKPGHLGEFTVAGKKSGYQNLDGIIVRLRATGPVQTVSAGMIRPGSLTGRVIDTEGNPLAGFPLMIESPNHGFGADRTTDADGTFAADNLPPGQYLVQIGPKREERDELVEYSEEAFKVIDPDVEPSYWPGGLADRDMVLPIPVAGGARANAGTIVVRKKNYYRVHVSLAGECGPNERWIYKILSKPEEFPPAQEQFGACRKDFLLTGLKPGEHTLAVWVGRDVKAWGLAPFVITNANVETTLRLSPSYSVSGQVKAAEGHTLAELGTVQLLLRPERGLGATGMDSTVDANGMFNHQTVAWPQQLFSVEVRNPSTYVKEIRYNGLPLRSSRIDTVPGGRLEILLDTGAASVTGKGLNSREVLLVRDGAEMSVLGRMPPFQFMGGHQGGNDTLTIGNLPPGTYRMLMLPRNPEDEDMTDDDLAQRLARAEKITLEPNQQKTIEIK